MLPYLANISIRSLLLALAAVVALWILRRLHTAALQHAVWTVVVCGMLALFAFGQSLPRLPLRILNTPAAAMPLTPADIYASPAPHEESFETAQPPAPIPPKRRDSIDWFAVLAYLYAAVAFALLARFATGIFLVRKLVARGHAARAAVYESEAIAVPLTVGWLRPKILLPPQWREWNREKLDAVLAHEGAHVRRRDGLVAALAAVNRCIFWFHPLAWMLERKLALLAEQACDESCVAALGDRERYAHLLLEMALVVDGSHGRLRQHALTMAAGSHIRQRIDSLLQEGRTFSRGLTWTGWVAVTLCGIPLVFGAGAVELDRRPLPLSLELPRWSVPAPPFLEQKLPEQKRVRPLVTIAQAQPTPPPAQAPAPQSPAAAKPKFEVASIKPCTPGDGGGRGGGRSGSSGPSPDRLTIRCVPVMILIQTAYRIYADGHHHSLLVPMLIEGAPDWTQVAGGDRFTIEAKAEGSPGAEMMNGPMLQALLEDRFKLKIRHEIREAPVFNLTVVKGGHKLKQFDGSCTPVDLSMFPLHRDEANCHASRRANGSNTTVDAHGRSLDEFINDYLRPADTGRVVIDKTGITGRFDFHLEYTPEPKSDAADAGPSIFTALEEQLGLKLVPVRGSREFLDIDHVERPSEN